MAILYIIPTPIGNLEDITLRAIRILKNVDALACEDTRKTRILLQHYDIPLPHPCFSYHEHNEYKAGKGILNLLQQGKTVALCTDGGMPGISDPGYRIISEALDANFSVEVLPGPSAVPTALIRSGLPTSTFIFKGFAPKKPGQRQRFLEADRDSEHTLIIYETAVRIVSLLTDAVDILGDRFAAVCFELTKLHERVYRAYLSELPSLLTQQDELKGELTVIITGSKQKFRNPERNKDDKRV